MARRRSSKFIAGGGVDSVTDPHFLEDPFYLLSFGGWAAQ